MRVTVFCRDLSRDDLTYIKTIKSGSARIRVTTDGSLTTIVASGTYDELVQIIIAVTVLKNFEVHLS